MTDLFHDAVPFEYIAAVWGAMACAPNHLFYVLTKRPERALEFAAWFANDSIGHRIAESMHRFGAADDESACHVTNYINGWSRWRTMPDDGNPLDGTRQRWPLPNVAFGVTCEDPRFGVPRLDLARQFPARWRWTSVEPQLADLGDVSFAGFDLLVQGGEAGPGSRPFDLAWARKVRDQAKRDGARYFLKQAGDFVIDMDQFVWRAVDDRDLHSELVAPTGKIAARPWTHGAWRTFDERGRDVLHQLVPVWRRGVEVVVCTPRHVREVVRENATGRVAVDTRR